MIRRSATPKRNDASNKLSAPPADKRIRPPNSQIEFCTEIGEGYYVFLHGFYDSGVTPVTLTRGVPCDPSDNPDCNNPPCLGDANADNTVDVNDISFVLFRLGDPCPSQGCPGDANRDATVDVNDVSCVLFRLGDPC